MGAERQRGLGVTLQRGPEVSGRVGLGLKPDLGEQLAQQRARPGATRRPSRTRWAPSGPPVRRSSSRRSAITRAASIAGPSLIRPRRRRRSACARQWAPPPPRVNIDRSSSWTVRPRARICCVQGIRARRSRAPARRRARSRWRRAGRHRRPRPRSTRSPRSRSQVTNPPERTSVQTAASRSASTASSTSMWTKRSGIGSTRTSQPSSASQPASCRAAGSWVRASPAPITAQPGSRIITSPPSRAPAVIMPRIGISGVLVEADRSRVLAAAPPLVELRDHRSTRGHGARVASEHLIRQRRVGLQEVDPDAGLLVCGDHRGVLAPRQVAVEALPALQGRAGDRAGRQPAEVVGGAGEDVQQPSVLGVDAPGSLGLRSRGRAVAHSLTTRMVRRLRSTAPLTQPPCSTTSWM